MKKQYYFISGLPRSGSTMLSALLKQNPNMYSNISDELHAYTIGATSHESYDLIHKNETLKNVFKGIINGFYENIDKPIIFNTHRNWTYYTHILKYIYPKTKIIVCVRSILQILNSFESAHRKNLLKFNTATGSYKLSVYERTEIMLGKEGIIGNSYNGIKQALYSNETDMLLFVEYDDLCTNPEATMKRIYNFIEQPYFSHDFQNIESDEGWQKFDEHIGIELHTVHKEIFNKERKCLLPIDIQRRLKDLEIWRDKYPKLYS